MGSRAPVVDRHVLRETCRRARGARPAQTYGVASIWDVHVGSHAEGALRAFMRWFADVRPPRLIIGGDFIDLESLSTHGGNHRPPSTVDEVRLARDVLKQLRKASPGTKWDYLEGNHETRHERTIVERLPTYYGVASIPQLLGLDEFNCDWHPFNRLFRVKLPSGNMSKLRYLHGKWTNEYHTAKHLRAYGVNVRYGHTHRPQSHIIGLAEGRVIGAWGSPCLRTLDPDWCPQPNGWVNGFGYDEFLPSGMFQPHQILMVGDEFAWNGKIYHG